MGESLIAKEDNHLKKYKYDSKHMGILFFSTNKRDLKLSPQKAEQNTVQKFAQQLNPIKSNDLVALFQAKEITPHPFVKQ